MPRGYASVLDVAGKVGVSVYLLDIDKAAVLLMGLSPPSTAYGQLGLSLAMIQFL